MEQSPVGPSPTPGVSSNKPLRAKHGLSAFRRYPSYCTSIVQTDDSRFIGTTEEMAAMHTQPPSAAVLSSKGRVATLGEWPDSAAQLTVGMFIIDHFEIRDAAGRPTVLDEESVSPLLRFH